MLARWHPCWRSSSIPTGTALCPHPKAWGVPENTQGGSSHTKWCRQGGKALVHQTVAGPREAAPPAPEHGGVLWFLGRGSLCSGSCVLGMFGGLPGCSLCFGAGGHMGDARAHPTLHAVRLLAGGSPLKSEGRPPKWGPGSAQPFHSWAEGPGCTEMGVMAGGG